MGRSKQNKKRQDDSNKKRKANFQNSSKHNRGNKRQRKQRFWIEDCKDSNFPEGTAFQVEVLITRGEVTDDYRQVSRSAAGVASAPPKEDNGDDTKVTGKESTTETAPAQNNLLGSVGDGDEGDEESKGNEGAPEQGQKEASEEREAADAPAVSKTPTPDVDPDKAAATPPLKQKASAKPVGLRVSVKRSKSAKRPIRGDFNSVENFEPLPDGDCGDGIKNPFPKDEVPDKFWSQRRRLFTRFDDGIELDKESWYSVTPEAIANHIAGRLAANREKLVVVDLFCGCGGNAIAFAQRDEVDLVVCIDRDLGKLKKAAKNASIYEVPTHKMIFVQGLACEVIDHFEDGKRIKSTTSETVAKNESGFKMGGLNLLPEKIGAVFLSPPWGGMDYVKVGKRNYSLNCIKIQGKDGSEFDGESLLDRASKGIGSNPVIIFLPRNINGVKLGESAIKAGYEGPIILEQNVLNGKLKTATAYLGL